MDLCKNIGKEKLTDEEFLKRITVGILSIVLCLVFLAVSTWAWYECSRTVKYLDREPDGSESAVSNVAEVSLADRES